MQGQGRLDSAIPSFLEERSWCELRVVARNKIKERREITEDLGFREKLRGEVDVLFEFLAIL